MISPRFPCCSPDLRSTEPVALWPMAHNPLNLRLTGGAIRRFRPVDSHPIGPAFAKFVVSFGSDLGYLFISNGTAMAFNRDVEDFTNREQISIF